jgi:hypothetical protein
MFGRTASIHERRSEVNKVAAETLELFFVLNNEENSHQKAFSKREALSALSPFTLGLVVEVISALH